MFFETIYPELEGLSGEQMVCCPFPHTKADGTTYYDHSPSMCINLDKRVYHCCSCGASGNESKMVAELHHVDTRKAVNLISMLKYGVNRGTYYNEVNTSRDKLTQKDNEYYEEVCAHFGLDKELLKKELVLIKDNEWITPVIWHDHVVDIRTYRPGGTPKVKSQPGAPSGLIIPYDSWDPERMTVICAGEKDMWVTRSRGFNAITFTGGEMNSTFFDLKRFRGVNVAICYDNDQTGRRGAEKLASILYAAGAHVKNVTRFHDDFPAYDTKEDLTDWFVNYHHTPEELKEYIADTPDYIPDETGCATVEYPELSIFESLNNKYDGVTYRARVQILMVSDDTFQVGKEFTVAKVNDEATGNTQWSKGEKHVFSLDEKPELLFSLIGQSEQRQIEAVRKNFCPGEKDCVTRIKGYDTCVVAQVADIHTDYESRREMPVVCVNFTPVQGKVYDMVLVRTHSIYNGSVGAICSEAVEINQSIGIDLSNSNITDDLLTIKHVEGTVKERVESRARKVQGLVGYEAPLKMIIIQDLCFNSVRAFNLLNGVGVKGYLDTLIIGESRVGKSDVANHLRDTYELGEFVSLAGSSATLPGIVGGSCRDALGKMSTKAGVIPRNDGSIIVFEELSKAPDDILRSLTDVRSSGKARITRVSGAIEMPASCRMCTLSNAKPCEDGSTRPLDNYASGVDVVQELIGTAEDIARYDICCLVGNPARINPSFNADEPYEAHILQNAIRFVWSLTPEQIEFVDGADVLIQNLNDEFNKQNPIDIKLFGPEGWKKLGRISCAVAGYIMSTDEHFTKLLVTPEIVEYAYELMKSCYYSGLFKLEEYTSVFMSHHVATKKDLDIMQDVYTVHPDALELLNKMRKMASPQLNTILAGDDKENRLVISKLMSRFLIEQVGRDYRVTAKWNAVYSRLKKVRVDVLDAPLDIIS